MHKTTTPTQYRQELRTRILQVSIREFATKGLKAVKMDDIANMLSISKRTLYEIYPNKGELLYAGLKMREEAYENYMLSFANTGQHNVMDIILEFYRTQVEMLANTNPAFFIELHKYQPVVEYLEQQRKEREEKANLFFQRGVEEGFFLQDVNYSIVTRIGNASMQYVMDAKMYKEYDIQYIFRNIVLLFIRGICTPKGVAVIDAFLNRT